MMLPADCVALIVKEPSLDVLALDCVLGDIGCATLGPLVSVQEVGQLLAKQRPSFALLDGLMGERILRPVAKRLTGHGVPFALLTLGAAQDAFDRDISLRVAPRLARYLHAPTLYATAESLYRVDLRTRLGDTDRRIEEGQQRLARQLRLIESLEVAGAEFGGGEMAEGISPSSRMRFFLTEVSAIGTADSSASV